MKRSELKEMIKASMLEEAKEVKVKDDETVDVDIEKEVDIDDESTESDIEVDTMMPGESETEQEIQGLLMKAQEEAAKLGDEKLTDQIGNTITYFTRAHISQVDEAEDYDSEVADISIDNPAEDAEVGFTLEESLVTEARNFKKAKQALIDFNNGKIGEDDMVKSVVKSLGFKFDEFSEEEAGLELSFKIKKGKIPTDNYILNNVIDVLSESVVNEEVSRFKKLAGIIK